MAGHGRAVRTTLGVAIVAFTLLLGISMPAMAEPDTPVKYPKGSSASRANGEGFDTCTAPSLNTLRAWRKSDYRTVNIYFGGINRSCRQPNLTTSWVRRATSMGWNLLPTYVGRQPRCVIGADTYTFSKSNARSWGRTAAANAVTKAKALGLLPGSALYADIEHYDRSSKNCRIAVRRYVSAWTKKLHANGYLAGAYVHHRSGLRDLSARYNSTVYARPDAIWLAKWDRKRSLRGWPRTPDNRWSVHQRAKQYRGDHRATWGGASLRIDSNRIDAPTATVARRYRVTSSVSLNGRSGPTTSYSVVRRYAPGSTLRVVCQGRGQQVGSTSVWDRLANGTWVSDRYVSTPSSTGFSRALPQCTYPGQVTSRTPLNVRKGPGTSYALSGNPLPRGALAWVTCQKKGSTVFGNRVWNRLADGRWVSDYYVATRSSSGWSAPIPRCR